MLSFQCINHEGEQWIRTGDGDQMLDEMREKSRTDAEGGDSRVQYGAWVEHESWQT